MGRGLPDSWNLQCVEAYTLEQTCSKCGVIRAADYTWAPTDGEQVGPEKVEQRKSFLEGLRVEGCRAGWTNQSHGKCFSSRENRTCEGLACQVVLD